MSGRGITRRCMYFNIVNVILLKWFVVNFKGNQDISINNNLMIKMMMPRRVKMTMYIKYIYILIYDY